MQSKTSWEYMLCLLFFYRTVIISIATASKSQWSILSHFILAQFTVLPHSTFVGLSCIKNNLQLLRYEDLNERGHYYLVFL